VDRAMRAPSRIPSDDSLESPRASRVGWTPLAPVDAGNGSPRGGESTCPMRTALSLPDSTESFRLRLWFEGCMGG